MSTFLCPRSLRRSALVYAALSAFLLLFSTVYHAYSYGVVSPLLRWCFLIPLGGGLAPTLLLLGKKRLPIGRMAFRMHNSALACFTAGCIVRGVIEISGRVTKWDVVYWIFGAGFLFSAWMTQTFELRQSGQ